MMLSRLHRLSFLTGATLLFFLSPGNTKGANPQSLDLLTAPATLAQSQLPRNVLELDAGVLYQNGRKQLFQGNAEEALKTFEEYLKVVRKLDDRQAEGIALYYIGWARANLSQYQQALQFNEQALAIFQELDDREWQGLSFNAIALLYENLGQYQTALDYHNRSLEIAKKLGDRSTEATSLNNIGLLYRTLGQDNKALEFYQQALTLFREVQDVRGQAVTLNNIGYVYDQTGEHQKALELYEQSLKIDTEINYLPGQATVLNNIALVYHNLGEYEKALEFFEKSLTLEKELGNLPGFGPTLRGIGDVYLDRKDYEKALKYYEQALAIETELGDRIWQGWSLHSMGVALLFAGKFSEATEKFLDAIKVWESLRPGLTDENKVSLFEKQAETYSYLQQALIGQNQIEAALEIAERSRARAFVELLASRLTSDSGEEAIASLKPPTIAEIKQIAKEQNATLVTYSIGTNKLYIWVIDPNDTIAFRTVDLSHLEMSLAETAARVRVVAATGISRGSELQNNAIASFVRGTREEIKIQDNPAVNSAPTSTRRKNPRLLQSYRLLLEPIVDLLPKNPDDRVIFIPQGTLFLIPFPALQDEEGNYLIEKHTLLTAPSIQVLDLTRQQREKQSSDRAISNSVLIVGNPTMPSIPPSLGEKPIPLAPLPGAEIEAIAIANLLNTEAIIGDRATEAAIVPKLSQAGIVHLATHGLLDELKHLGFTVPGAIALTPSQNAANGTPTTQDGFLTTSEILGLKLNASLVVLSACNTGRGTITGDGVIGLSRAFISAGVPSAIVSLWAVPDEPTADLMTEFYRQMQSDRDKASALRQAMLVTMQKYPHPRDWAAFTLIGEAK